MRLTKPLSALPVMMVPSVAAQKDSPSPAETNSPSSSPSNDNKEGPSQTPPWTSPSSLSSPSSDNPSTAIPTNASGTPSVSAGPEETMASITSITDDASAGEPTAFPTLTGPGLIPSYPPASVPPTENAPFMRQSTLPEGTVFIVVGAVLGALGLALLLWRTFASFMLHRAVERAALARHVTDHKTSSSFPAPPAPFYKYSDQASSLSLGGGGSVLRKSHRGSASAGAHVTSGPPSQSNLFFSPTASQAAPPSHHRTSVLLPSGFYAAGGSSPGGVGNPRNSISLTNLRADAHGHYAHLSRQTLDSTPPDSPPATARMHNFSTSSLNVSLVPDQRPPSAYLDDLLMDEIPPWVSARRASNPGSRF